MKAGARTSVPIPIGQAIACSLVFSDVEMPGPNPMGGVGLALWISQPLPDVDVILTSGYRHDAQAVGAKVFLPKPYRDAAESVPDPE